MGTFRGWPPEAIEFLRDLEAHNERDWFKANRHRYDDFLLAPAKALGADLEDLGRPRTFRPYNDTRFHMKPPIKEQLGLAIGFDPAHPGGFYVELSLDGLLVATGLHNPTRDQLDRFRRAVDDGRKAGALTRALGKAAEAGLVLGEPELKRAPKGWPADHPRIELLRRRSIIAGHRQGLPKWLHGKGAGDRIRAQLEAGAPLVRWVREHVGPPQAGDRRAAE